MTAIIISLSLLIVHWFVSLFCQSFFLHRYAAHSMFKMSPFFERFFFMLTFFSQGSSFLNPRAYAYLHRQHHAYSDTEKDPHSPVYFKKFYKMMWQTAKIYSDTLKENAVIPKDFRQYVPSFPFFERFADSWITRTAWVGVYIAIYALFAPWWITLLAVPIHALMGPIHGSIVNWCGHKFGYRNFNIKDQSRNTLIMDFFLMGELYQNNHHGRPTSLNFAYRWYEVDPTYYIARVLAAMRIIQFVPAT